MKLQHFSIGLLVVMVLGLLLFVGLPTGYMQNSIMPGVDSEATSGVGYPIVIDPSDSSLSPASSLYSNGINWGFGTVSPLERLTLAANSNMVVQMRTPVNVIVTPESGGALSAGNYYFKVVASDSVGLTTGSAEVVCTVDGITTNRCALQWDAVPGADFYRVYKGSAAGGQDRYKAAATNLYNYNTDVGASFGTVPQVTSAYVVKLQASGNSWLLGQNVGIGTTAPTSKLHVRTDGSDNIVARFESSEINAAIIALDSTAPGGRTYRIYSSANAHSKGAGKFFIYDEDADEYRLSIRPEGNVGIGTTHAESKLEVNGRIAISNGDFGQGFTSTGFGEFLCGAQDGTFCEYFTGYGHGGLLMVEEWHGNEAGAFGQHLYMFKANSSAPALLTEIAAHGASDCSISYVDHDANFTHRWRLTNSWPNPSPEGHCFAYYIKIH